MKLKRLVGASPADSPRADMVWNTLPRHGRNNPAYYTLESVLNRLRGLGHAPRNGNCTCCFHCEKCGKTLLDDLRTEISLTEPCAPAKLAKRKKEK